MMATPCAQMFTEELPALRIDDTHVQVVPLHRDALTDPARRHAVVRGLDFDAAIEVHAARAVAIVAKGLERERLQMRALLRKHRAHLTLGGAVDARVGPARLPLIEVRLRRLNRLEALAAQRRLLRVPDARFHFAFAIRIAHATRQRDHVVVREHIAVERIDGRVIHVGLQHAFAQIVEHDHADRAAEAPKRLFVQFGPDLTAGPPREQPHRFARVAERHHEEPRAAVLPAGRIAHHRPLAVIDLRFLAGRRLDDTRGLGREPAAHAPHIAPDAGIPAREAVLVDQVLPDRHRVPPATDRLEDQRAIRLTHARRRRARRHDGRIGDHRGDRRVGGHRLRGGRMWGRPLGRSAAPPPDRDAGGLEITTDGLAAHARRRLDAPKLKEIFCPIVLRQRRELQR